MSVTSDPGARLRWCQPELPQSLGHHELRGADDRVLGTLQFQPKPAVTWVYTDRRLAVAEVESGRWEFSVERKGVAGFFGLAATVHVTGADSGGVEAGVFFSTGTLRLTTGRQFQWSGGAARRGPSAFRANTVEVEPAASTVAERRLLIALGLYLRLAMNKVFR